MTPTDNKKALEALVDHLLKKEFLPPHVRPMIEILGRAALTPSPVEKDVGEAAMRIAKAIEKRHGTTVGYDAHDIIEAELRAATQQPVAEVTVEEFAARIGEIHTSKAYARDIAKKYPNGLIISVETKGEKE